jgi:hypothetical protein
MKKIIFCILKKVVGSGVGSGLYHTLTTHKSECIINFDLVHLTLLSLITDPAIILQAAMTSVYNVEYPVVD